MLIHYGILNPPLGAMLFMDRDCSTCTQCPRETRGKYNLTTYQSVQSGYGGQVVHRSLHSMLFRCTEACAPAGELDNSAASSFITGCHAVSSTSLFVKA